MWGREAAGVGEPCPGLHPLRALKLRDGGGWAAISFSSRCFSLSFPPSRTEILNHVSAFPAIYTGMIHTGVDSCL